MAPVRIIYSVTRYWRCYFLLLVASILSFFLIYVSKNDPNLEYYFPYFRLGSNYYNFYALGGAEKLKKLMEENYLDYEFLKSNSRYCISAERQQQILNQFEEDNRILSDEETGNKELKNALDHQSSSHLDFILLTISQAANFKHRIATRSTWAKQLDKFNSKLVFIVGNPKFAGKISTENQFSPMDQAKLDKEIVDHGDLVQINMPDHENYTSTKTLISIRWALTYCLTAKNIFVLSDSAVLNWNNFAGLVKNTTFNEYHNDSTITGQCNYTDENFALALKLFFNDLYKNSKKEETSSTSSSSSTTTPNRTGQEKDENAKARKSFLARSADNYKGQYCSNLGWFVSIKGAQRLWLTALRSPYMMKISPAYLSGYLAYKANLIHSDLLTYHDSLPLDMNCLKVFEKNPKYLLCAENFTISSRYSSYIATWNSPAQGSIVLSKL